MLKFDPDKTYRLVDVTGKDGEPKADREKFYKERVGCIATHLHADKGEDAEASRVFMDFIRTADNRRTNLTLHTSVATEARYEGERLTLFTTFSIYYFVEEKVEPTTFLQETNLIELYMTDTESNFCEGYFYDEHGAVHPLALAIRVSFIEDTYMLYCKNRPILEYGCVARYYCEPHGIGFYDTIKKQYEHVLRILIHNEAACDFTVTGTLGTYVIPVGGSTYIEPLAEESEKSRDVLPES